MGAGETRLENMKEILQPIVDQVVSDWNKLYPQMTVRVVVKKYGIEAGRVIIDGNIGIQGVGVTDGVFDIGSDANSWDHPDEFYNGLTECIEESMLAHSQYQQNRESRSL